MSRTQARERFITMVGVLPHRTERTYLLCPNDKLTRALLAVVENGIEIKSVVANIRVIGMDKLRWSTDVRFDLVKKCHQKFALVFSFLT